MFSMLQLEHENIQSPIKVRSHLEAAAGFESAVPRGVAGGIKLRDSMGSWVRGEDVGDREVPRSCKLVYTAHQP